ncbi:hypothetical protein [Hyphomicrobium sp. ghe19]|uniref:hypothetical protein n=1 Tax=Hyphomicrobium sp. ghe19 TaxID=2682968 RepID=UPI001366BD85|nr:hypothetical protein HYPP_02390 [Hyphomicrobium sp. ghe19]
MSQGDQCADISANPYSGNSERSYQIVARHGEGRGTTAERRNRKRHIKCLIRRWYKKHRKQLPLYKRLRGISKPVLMSQYRPNHIADILVSDRKRNWKPISRRKRQEITITLKNLSFIDNPRQTMQMLRTLAQSESEYLSVRVNFDDVSVADLGAYVVLGELWQNLSPVFSGGRIHPAVQKVIDAVALRKYLHMAPFTYKQRATGMWALPMRRRHSVGEEMTIDRQLGPQKREKVADEFCDWIDECLGVPEINQQLTQDGKAWVANLIGELLDNAERHSGSTTGDGVWSVAGFMSQTHNGEAPGFMLSVAILSLGQCISDSLRSAADAVQDRMNKYAEQHKKSGCGGGTLRTVVALQDYVTRVKEASEDERGGIGFQEVFDFAHELGQNSVDSKMPRITLISGRACVHVAHPFVKGERTEGDGRPRELWFNAENTPSNAPESSHVYDLGEEFPGTLITIRINLDPTVLRAGINE